MAQTTITLTGVSRLRNSRNGNPRYRLAGTTADGGYVRVTTSADAACAYEVGNAGFRVGDTVTLAIGGRGTVTGMVQR
ncbi:MAG TPA: hypothetical protein VF288_10765 [Mycobacteriales bacterium]